MKKLFFTALAIVAFAGSASAQTSGNPVTSNPCVQEGFKAGDEAAKKGKKGGEIADAADKALKDCEAKKNQSGSGNHSQQALTLSRF